MTSRSNSCCKYHTIRTHNLLTLRWIHCITVRLKSQGIDQFLPASFSPNDLKVHYHFFPSFPLQLHMPDHNCSERVAALILLLCSPPLSPWHISGIPSSHHRQSLSSTTISETVSHTRNVLIHQSFPLQHLREFLSSHSIHWQLSLTIRRAEVTSLSRVTSTQRQFSVPYRSTLPLNASSLSQNIVTLFLRMDDQSMIACVSC